jgi:soluble lytic murein transglycosylase-like protein
VLLLASFSPAPQVPPAGRLQIDHPLPPAAHAKRPSLKAASIVPVPPSAFAVESELNSAGLMRRWEPLIAKASLRFNVPVSWIRAVIRVESGGRTMLAESTPIVSSQGAMGLMQVMPQTYEEMAAQYGLGSDPYNPHDNIFAGAAYLRQLHARYGYPTMFQAYDDGPGNLEERLVKGGLLPAETRNYVGRIELAIRPGGKADQAELVQFTRPDGSAVMIDCAMVNSVRAALPEEYAPGVQSVLSIGKQSQGVREGLAVARSRVRTHGGRA